MSGIPTPGVLVGTGPLPVRNWATQQDVSSRAREQSFICIYSHSLLLALPPELHFLSSQWQHNRCNVLESSPNYHPCHSLWKKMSSMKPILVPKRLGTTDDTFTFLWIRRSSSKTDTEFLYLQELFYNAYTDQHLFNRKSVSRQ